MSKKTLILLSCFVMIGLAITPIPETPNANESAKMLEMQKPPDMGRVVRKFSNVEMEKAETDASLWGPNVRLTNNTYTDYTDQYSQKNVVAELSGRVHVVWSDGTSPYNVHYMRYTPGFGWSNDTIISNSGQTYERYPSVALDSSGVVHVVYQAGSSTSAYYRVYYKSCTPVGTGNDGWAADTLLSNILTTNIKYYPTIACSPNGNVHVVWREYNSTSPYYYRAAYLEKIAGVWQSQVNLDSSSVSPYDYKYNPSIAAGRDNNVHITWYGYYATTSPYAIIYKARIGGVWQTTELVQYQASYTQYYPTVAVNNLTNEPHIAWQGYPSPYYIVHSYRTSGAWTAPETVSIYTDPYDYHYYPQISNGPSGKMHVVWYEYESPSASYLSIAYRERSAAGVWGPRFTISNSTSSCYMPSVTVNDSDYAHAVWRDLRDGNYEVYYVKGSPPFNWDMATTALNISSPVILVNDTISISATINNFGANPVASGLPVILDITMGSYVYRDTEYTTAALASGASTVINFVPDWVGAVRGFHSVKVWTVLAGEQNPSNDTMTASVDVYPSGTLYESFTQTAFPPNNWALGVINGTRSFERYTGDWYTAPACVYYNCYSISTGYKAWMQTPRLDLTVRSDDSLIFYFKTPLYSLNADSLQILISTDLGSNWTEIAVLTGAAILNFTRYAYNLEGYTQNNQCYIRFVGHSQYDHNLIIDDILGPPIWPIPVDARFDAAYPVTYPLAYMETDTIEVVVTNAGAQAITTPFYVHCNSRYAMTRDSALVSGMTVGETKYVQVPFSMTTSYMQELDDTIDVYIGLVDSFPFNNAGWFNDHYWPTGTYYAVDFENNHTAYWPTQWWTINNNGDSYYWTWYVGSYYHSYNQYVGCYRGTNPNRGDDWLISPAITPSVLNADSFGFWWRAYSASYQETLEVWVLRDTTVADTIAMIWADTTHNTSYMREVLSLDAYDDSTIHVGVRYRGMSTVTPYAYRTYMDDFWFSALESFKHDVAVTTINAPTGNVDTINPKVPRATFYNYGEVAESFFDVTFDITGPGTFTYTSTKTVASLDPLNSITVDFDTVKFNELGTHNVVCYISTPIPGDTNRLNDTLFSTFVGVEFVPPEPWQPMADVPAAPSGKNPKSGSCLAGLEATELLYFLKASNRPDFYSYDPETNAWNALETIPKGEKSADYADGKYPKRGAAMAAYEPGKCLYVVRGNNRLGFWKYQADTLGDTLPGVWSPKATIPAGAKRCKYGTGLVHVTKGGEDKLFLLKGAKTSEAYLYDIATNTWSAVTDVPAGASGKTGYKKGSCIAYDGSEYVYILQGYYGSFFKYKVEADSYIQLKWYDYKTYVNRDGKKKKPKDGASLVHYDNNIYMLKGGNTYEVWKYDIALDDWVQMGPANIWDIPTGGGKKVKDGGGMVYFGDFFWATKGKNTPEFYRHVLPSPVAYTIPKPTNDGVMGSTVKTDGFKLTIAPNPATNLTAIKYNLPVAGPVTFKLYNITGALVKSHTITQPTKDGVLTLDAKSLPAGVYMLRFNSGEIKVTRKLVLEK